MTVLPALRSPVAGVSVKRRDGRRRGVDLRAALGQAGEREIGGIAGAVLMVAELRLTAVAARLGGVLPGAHGVAEGQRIAAGAARIGGGAAVVERQRRGAARDRDRLAEIERQRDGVAGIEVAGGRATRSSDAMVGVVVSICGPLWVRPESERLAALPAPSLMVAELRLTAVAARLAVFWPAPTV